MNDVSNRIDLTHLLLAGKTSLGKMEDFIIRKINVRQLSVKLKRGIYCTNLVSYKSTPK